MSKAKILKALTLVSLATAVTAVTSGVFIAQERALNKEINTLENRRHTLTQLKDSHQKHAQEIDKILEKNPLVKQLADENFSGVRIKNHNLQIAIDQLKRNQYSSVDKTKYNFIAQQVKEFLVKISTKQDYKNIYESLKEAKNLTYNNVNKTNVTQQEVDSETQKLIEAFNDAKSHKVLEDKISIANSFNSQFEQPKYTSVKEQLQRIIDKIKEINNDKNSSEELLNKAAKDLQNALDNIKDQKDILDNRVIDSLKFLEYKQALQEANDYKNQLLNIVPLSEVASSLDNQIQKATKDSDGKLINQNTSSEDLTKAIESLHKAVFETSRPAFDTAINLAKDYLNNFNESKYSSFKTNVEKLINKYNNNVDSKTNNELQNQAREILNSIKSGRTKAEQKYDEILMFAKFFLADLTDNKKTQTKYVDIINGLKDSINTQNLIRNDSTKSARDILEAKDKLLKALNKVILDKKIFDAGDKDNVIKSAFENYKKQRAKLEEIKQSLDSDVYADFINKIDSEIAKQNDKVAKPTDLNTPKDEATVEDITKATEALKDIFNEAQIKVPESKKISEAKTEYDNVVNKINEKLKDPKYQPLLQAFENANQLNKTKRYNKFKDKETKINTINEATEGAKELLEKINEVLPKYDELDAKHKEAEAELNSGDMPVIRGKFNDGSDLDRNRPESDDMYEVVRNEIEEALGISGFDVFKDLLDISAYDYPIQIFDDMYSNSHLTKAETKFQIVFNEAWEWDVANVKDFTIRNQFAYKLIDLHKKVRRARAVEEMEQYTQQAKDLFAALKAEISLTN